MSQIGSRIRSFVAGSLPAGELWSVLRRPRYYVEGVTVVQLRAPKGETWQILIRPEVAQFPGDRSGLWVRSKMRSRLLKAATARREGLRPNSTCARADESYPELLPVYYAVWYNQIAVRVLINNTRSIQRTTLRGEASDLLLHPHREGRLTWEEVLIRLFQVNVNFKVPLRLRVIWEMKNLLDNADSIVHLLLRNPLPIVRFQFKRERRLLGVDVSANDLLLE